MCRLPVVSSPSAVSVGPRATSCSAYRSMNAQCSSLRLTLTSYPPTRSRPYTKYSTGTDPSRLRVRRQVKAEEGVVVDDLDGRVGDVGRVDRVLGADHQQLARVADLEAVLRLREGTVLGGGEVVRVPSEGGRTVVHRRRAVMLLAFQQREAEVADDVVAVRGFEDEVRLQRVAVL